MPTPAVWGPVLWEVLHGLGFRSGKGPEYTAIDEKREVIWLIKHLEDIIPCRECRTHITAFKKREGFNNSGVGPWIWQLHESVNERLGKVSVPFTTDIGSRVNIRQTWKIYLNTLHESILMGSVKGSAVKDYNRRVGLWAGFAGL